jgi:hypothetical protein
MRSKLNLGIQLSVTLLFSLAFNSPSLAQTPKSECRSGFGQTVCGYNCIAANGKVRCAEWPGGVCKAAYDDVVCGPIAPTGWKDSDLAYLSSVPKAECYSAEGQTVCGYNCTSAYGEVACAEWPGGVCKPSDNGVVCGPPAPDNWLVKYVPRDRPYYRRYYYYTYPNPYSSSSVVECVRDLIDLGVSEDNAAIACSNQ